MKKVVKLEGKKTIAEKILLKRDGSKLGENMIEGVLCTKRESKED